MTNIIIDGIVRHLWDVTIRSMGFTKSQCEPFTMTIACHEINQKPVHDLIRRRFTPEWWADKLIIDLNYRGKLHMIDDCPLYEED